MAESPDDDDAGRGPFRVRIPGFVGDEDIGLGEAVQRVTYRLGVSSCGGCQQRRTALNRWVVFVPTRAR